MLILFFFSCSRVILPVSVDEVSPFTFFFTLVSCSYPWPLTKLAMCGLYSILFFCLF